MLVPSLFIFFIPYLSSFGNLRFFLFIVGINYIRVLVDVSMFSVLFKFFFGYFIFYSNSILTSSIIWTTSSVLIEGDYGSAFSFLIISKTSISYFKVFLGENLKFKLLFFELSPFNNVYFDVVSLLMKELL